MAETEQLKNELIQQQIIKAAENLFKVHGFNKVNMDDVAKAVGKGRSSLYYYYKNKEDIFIDVMDIAIRKIITDVSKAVESAPTAEKKLHAFYTTRLNLAKKRKELYNAVDSGMDADELSRYTKVKRIIHKRIFKQEGELLRKVLASGIEGGELVDMSAEEQNSLIYVLLSNLHGLKREMIIDGNYSQIEHTVNALIKALMRGIKR